MLSLALSAAVEDPVVTAGGTMIMERLLFTNAGPPAPASSHGRRLVGDQGDPELAISRGMSTRRDGKWCWYRSIESRCGRSKLASSAAGRSSVPGQPAGRKLGRHDHRLACGSSSLSRRSDPPPLYMAAVSKKLTPAARLASNAACSAASPAPATPADTSSVLARSASSRGFRPH